MRGMKARWCVLLVAASVAMACLLADARPATLETGHEACGYCRMVISDARFASQIVVPYEEPKFFDDLGCLTKHLERNRPLPDAARIYVADHRTKVWVLADNAVYTEVPAISAPMGSHYMAHESGASRSADPDAAGGGPAVDSTRVFGGRSSDGDRQ